MAPEALISIQTFEGEKSNVTRQQENLNPVQNRRLVPKQDGARDNADETKDKDSPPHKRIKMECEETDEDANKGDRTTDAEEMDNSAASETMVKKKKSRKKKKKIVDTSPEATGMLVLSKTEWKKLRNQYLNLQRTKMQKLKTHLQTIKRNQWTPPHLLEEKKSVEEKPKKLVEEKPKKLAEEKPKKAVEEATKKSVEEAKNGNTAEVEKEKLGIEFVPEVIVRVHLEQPLVDVKLFKSELRHNPSVKYIDATEGSQEVFVRCINPEEAKNLASSKTFPHCDILKGEEEILYWEKIDYDRKVKFSTKTKVCRGRTKLLKKAEKALGKHIRFDAVEG